MRFFTTVPFAFVVLLACQLAFADDSSQIHCMGLAPEKMPLEVSLTIDENDGASGQVKLGDRTIDLSSLSWRLSYQKGGPSTLHWSSIVQDNAVTIQRSDKENFKITYRLANVPAGAFNAQLNAGETTNAYCVTSGQWAAQLEETIPTEVKDLVSLMHESPPSAVERAISMMQNSDFSIADKETLFNVALGSKDLTAHTKQMLATVAFSEPLSPSFQMRLIEVSKMRGADFASTSLQSIATCLDCPVNNDVYRHLTALVRAEINARTSEAIESWQALANLTFRDKVNGLPARAEALELIFSPAVFRLGASDQQLGILASLLGNEIPSDHLAGDYKELFDRLLNHPNFAKLAAKQLASSLILNHANPVLGRPALNPVLELRLLQKLASKNLLADQMAHQCNGLILWLKGETTVATTLSTEMAILVAKNPTDPAILENVLAWLAAQKKTISGSDQILSIIFANLNKVDPDYLEFSFETRRRGVFADLATYGFSHQAAVAQNGFNVLAMLLTKQPLSNSLLQQIGMTVYSTTILSQAESEELLSLVVRHPNYVETRTSEMPEGMISTFLERALMREKALTAHESSPRFSVSFLNSLLKEIFTTRQFDRDDQELEKSATDLINKASSI